MHPVYHPIHRRTRLRWFLRAVSAYAVAELAAEVWETIRPRDRMKWPGKGGW
jgi:hypothetical protein